MPFEKFNTEKFSGGRKFLFVFLKITQKKSSKYNHQSFNKRACDLDKINNCLK